MYCSAYVIINAGGENVSKLSEVMKHINNYFVKTTEDITVNIVADGIEGTFTNTYIVGQYIRVCDSILNDGVYKLTGVTSSKLSVAETLVVESNKVQVAGLVIPSEFLSIVTEIEAHKGSGGVVSESIDDYSVTYSDGGSWVSAFEERLYPYTKFR